MERKALKAKLRQIISLVEECLNNLGDKKVIGNRGGKRNVQKVSVCKSLSDHIIELRDGGYFKQPKTAQEVHKKLQPIYPCDLNRVEVALLRLYKKRQLRKTSKIVGRKKIIAYVW